MFEYSDVCSLPYYSCTEITIRVSSRLLRGVLDALYKQTISIYLSTLSNTSSDLQVLALSKYASFREYMHNILQVFISLYII